MEFSFADLCAGIGGFRVALEELGGTCRYSCDLNKTSEETYKANFGEGYNIFDIFDIKENSFPSVDVLCAGFPCQPFSIAGKRLGFDDERGNVFFKIASITKAVRPKVLFLENVTNLKTMDKGNVFKQIVQQLEGIGYNIHYEILDSSNFGVPQARKRIYIVAVRSDINSFGFSFTKKKTAKVPFKEIIVKGDNSIPISEKWNTYIDLYTGKINIEDISFKVPKTRKAIERKDPTADLNNCVFQIRSSGIRALSIEKPLPTFAVSISGGGAMIPVYSKERRHLSLLEMVRLMGFKDNFEFPVSRTNAIKQLANAVCPPVIHSIASDFLPFLKKETSLHQISVNQ